MAATSGTGGSPAGQWYRVQAISGACSGGSADRDYAVALPAVLNAARHRRPFIAGWLSRGGGAPLELITNAGPLPAPRSWPWHGAPASPGGPDEADDGADTADPNAASAPVPDGPPVAGSAAGEAVDETGTGEPQVSSNQRRGGLRSLVPEEMLFPWGSQGAAAAGNMLADLDQLVWMACPGRLVPPADGARHDQDEPGLFESALQTLMARPFGWLIVADPTDLLEAEVAELRDQLSLLRRYDDEHASFDADRARRRLTELEAYREAGLWNVRVLVGAASEPELSVLAPLLIGSADLHAHPYRLRCGDGAQEFADALAARLADPSDGSRIPFAATAGALAALTGLPRRPLPGVRVRTPDYFDTTSHGDGAPAIAVGEILDGHDRAVGPFEVPLATLSRPVLVTGTSGTGKSHTVRHLLQQLTEAEISWLAIEPVKPDYGEMAARLGPEHELTLINPADPESVPLMVSPLAPEPGYPVQAHIDMVHALFLAAFDISEPAARVLSQALQRAYEECGWDARTGAGRADTDAPPTVPTLSRLRAAALAVMAEAGFGPELEAQVRDLLDGPLRRLPAGPAGRFLEGGHPAALEELLSRDVVLALYDVARDDDRAFLAGSVLIRIAEQLRLRARTAPGAGLRHVLVLEEATQLLRAGRQGPAAAAVEQMAALLAEVGAYGEGVVIVEQIPSKLTPDVLRNTALTVLHRLPGSDDRQLVGAVMNLDENQSRQVVTMRPGVAAVSFAGLDRPVRIRVPSGASVAANQFSGAGQAANSPQAALVAPGSRLLAARRSRACGPSCAGDRPCTLVQIRAAELLAADTEDAWLRVWAETYVLAYLANRPRPRVPVPLRQRWAGLDDRTRDCLLASALDRPLRSREQALRTSFDVRDLIGACLEHAAGMLAGGKGAGTMPGTMWVIPQLQWLHELERVCPMDGPAPDPFALAPPLDYALPGLSDRPDVKVGQRVSGLRRHQLSMEVTRNRLVAWTALLGEDDQSEFIEDLAIVAIGVSHRGQLRKAAGEMGVTGWLEAVLSWPRRFVVGADDQASILSAPEPQPVSR